MGSNRTRFRVRESTVTDPDWDVDRAIDMWQRMLSRRLQALAAEPKDHAEE